MTLKLRIAVGEQLGLVVSIASVWPAVFEVLAVKSYGAVHCLNRILDDNDPRYISTGDLILEANGHTDPTAMVHELLYRSHPGLFSAVIIINSRNRSHFLLSVSIDSRSAAASAAYVFCCGRGCV